MNVRDTVFVIASSSPAKLGRWKEAIRSLAPVLEVTSLPALKESLSRFSPRILLLDVDWAELDYAGSIGALRQLSTKTMIVALSDAASDETELALFAAGVRGCCRSDIDPQLVKRLVTAVLQGELWIRRSLTPRLLNELGAELRQESHAQAIGGRLSDLTQREREIATFITQGDSNKQIARRLVITERTVKAHLTEVFRKLRVADRLKLALLLTRRSES